MARGVQYDLTLILRRIDGKLAGLRQEREAVAGKLEKAQQHRADSVGENLELFDTRHKELEQAIENATDNDTAAWKTVREAATGLASIANLLAFQDQPGRDEIEYQGKVAHHGARIADLESKRELVAGTGVDKISSYELERLKLLDVLQ